jgi:hypothetical protein
VDGSAIVARYGRRVDGRVVRHSYVDARPSGVPRTDKPVALRDGRQLHVAEWGPADGYPVVLMHGQPASRLLTAGRPPPGHPLVNRQLRPPHDDANGAPSGLASLVSVGRVVVMLPPQTKGPAPRPVQHEARHASHPNTPIPDIPPAGDSLR